ncbi:unnamed protein product [Prorocentrum cordatum]|uniref:Uncharacterized protein n=1 Tax=Prorocentrum cordatum TaxID=2364126 RepID=A0ABN9T216_9DINO|nr:unnamed protein product [Polarella glacialis]
MGAADGARGGAVGGAPGRAHGRLGAIAGSRRRARGRCARNRMHPLPGLPPRPPSAPGCGREAPHGRRVLSSAELEEVRIEEKRKEVQRLLRRNAQHMASLRACSSERRLPEGQAGGTPRRGAGPLSRSSSFSGARSGPSSRAPSPERAAGEPCCARVAPGSELEARGGPEGPPRGTPACGPPARPPRFRPPGRSSSGPLAAEASSKPKIKYSPSLQRFRMF